MKKEEEATVQALPVVREKVCFFSLLYSSNDDVASLPFSTSCYLLSNDNNWGQFPSKERTNSITVSSPDSF